jgi:hypothetical protein
MTKGWYQESRRHAEAAKGIKTIKDNPGMVMAHSSKASTIQAAMNGSGDVKAENYARLKNELDVLRAKQKELIANSPKSVFKDYEVNDEETKKFLKEEGKLFDANNKIINESLKLMKGGKIDEGKALALIKEGEVMENEFGNSVLKNRGVKTMTFEELKKNKLNLPKETDTDKDGLKNSKDCQPLNKDKQGTIHEQREKDIEAANGEIEKFKDDQDKPLFEKRIRGVKSSEPDTGTFGKFEELKFKAKRAIPFVKTEPSEEAKELRTLRARQIKREGDRLRRDEIRELESIEELDPLEEKNLELNREVKEIRLEEDNKRLEAEIERKRPSIFGKAATEGKGILSDIL